MKKKMMSIAFGITIAAVGFVLFFVTVYFQYDAQRKQVQVEHLNFVSFPGYRWIDFSKNFPYSSTRIINSWIFQMIPSESQEGENDQYTIAKVRFEAFSKDKEQWVLLSENTAMREFKKVDQRCYAMATAVPSSLLLHEEIRVQIVVIVRDRDSDRATRKEMEFLHRVMKHKRYGNLIWDMISSA